MIKRYAKYCSLDFSSSRCSESGSKSEWEFTTCSYSYNKRILFTATRIVSLEDISSSFISCFYVKNGHRGPFVLLNRRIQNEMVIVSAAGQRVLQNNDSSQSHLVQIRVVNSESNREHFDRPHLWRSYRSHTKIAKWVSFYELFWQRAGRW